MIYMVGILLGFGLTVCGSNGWKLNRQLQQNENKAQRSRVIFFFHHKNVNFFVHICKLAIIFIFIFGTMYCCRHRLIFFYLCSDFFILFWILIQFYGAIGTKDFQSWIAKQNAKHDTHKKVTQKRKKLVEMRKKMQITTATKRHFSNNKKSVVHYFNFQVIIHFKWTRLICTYIL